MHGTARRVSDRKQLEPGCTRDLTFGPAAYYIITYIVGISRAPQY